MRCLLHDARDWRPPWPTQVLAAGELRMALEGCQGRHDWFTLATNGRLGKPHPQIHWDLFDGENMENP